MTDFNLKTESNQSRAEEFNHIQRRLSDFYKEPVIALISEFRRIGYTLEQISKIPGFPFSKQAISTNYLPSEQANVNSKPITNKSKGVTK